MGTNWCFNNGFLIRELLAKSYKIFALTFGIAPKTFRRYFDDSYAQFGSKANATEFFNVLNCQDPLRLYTTEYENRQQLMSSKPHSNLSSHITMAVFKGFFT